MVAGWLDVRLVGCLVFSVGWLIDRLAVWLVGRLAGWLIGWLVNWHLRQVRRRIIEAPRALRRRGKGPATDAAARARLAALGWLVEWSVGELAGWPIAWLMECLTD